MTPEAQPSGPAESAEPAPGSSGEAAAPRPTAFDIQLRTLRFADPLRWLALGWQDYRRAPGLGLFYGIVFVVMGWAIVEVFKHAPPYTLALSGGFLLVGPFLCLGIYRVSQRLEQGVKPGFADSVLAWQTKISQLGIFGFVLLVLEMLWARATLVVFAVTFDGMPDFKGSLLALLDPDNMTFIVAWFALGAIFATLIFAFTVVSMPMILDRQTDAITAALTSFRLVLTQPGVMFFWGTLIAVITFSAMLPWFVGLLVTGPLIGHATWHAYRASVVSETVPSA
ncbi:MAG: DUF2189 domain-containing protein [Rubrivivax sp.]|nr:DUF2189 domain-containing protein [Rubrivivax sp.]